MPVQGTAEPARLAVLAAVGSAAGPSRPLPESAAAGPSEAVWGAVLEPLWQSADDEPDESLWAAPVPALPEGARAWSPAVAALAVPPAAPAGGGATTLPSHLERRRSRTMTVAAVVAMVVAGAVVAASRLQLGSTSGPSTSPPGFAVTELRTVDAASESAVDTTPTSVHIPWNAPGIYLSLGFSGAASQDSVEVRVTRDATAVHPSTTVVDDGNYPISGAGSGRVHIRLDDPTGLPLQPGSYTVTALHEGQVLRSTVFVIDDLPAAAG